METKKVNAVAWNRAIGKLVEAFKQFSGLFSLGFGEVFPAKMTLKCRLGRMEL